MTLEILRTNFSKQLSAGILALICAVLAGFIINYINSLFADGEKAVKIVGVTFAVLLALPPVIYLLKQRKETKLENLGLIVIASILVLLTACYFFQASFYINFPADVVIWSESDFVNDILKFRQGYPIYTAEVNNESFTYTIGSQLLTYFLAWFSGHPNSIPAYRTIQVGYTIVAAFVAFLCCRRLIEIALPDRSKNFNSPLWGIIWLVGLFLIATNFVTNPFSHLLHNDALAQLVTVTAFWLLLEYDKSEDKRLLWLMILIPALGFWVKQSLIIWAVFYTAYLIFFSPSRSLQKIAAFAFASFGGILISVGIGYLFWHEHFIYWVFTVLGAHGVSPLRSFRHLLHIWVYFAAGLFGGLILLQFGKFKKLFGLWMIWLAVISLETYTSGVAWMLNHIGPGCLIAGIWFWSAIAVLWSKLSDASVKTATGNEWFRVATGAALICLIFSGFSIIRVPVRSFDYADGQRYVKEIEKEFAGQSPESVLLDFGTWVYMPSGVIMKDRAPTIGERGYSQTGDFSAILQRLENKDYKKILVRNFHSTDFWYDHELWTKSSGIRQALTENYTEVGKIAAVKGLNSDESPYGFKEISILIPKEK